jgi:hypothetical protein
VGRGRPAVGRGRSETDCPGRDGTRSRVTRRVGVGRREVPHVECHIDEVRYRAAHRSLEDDAGHVGRLVRVEAAHEPAQRLLVHVRDDRPLALSGGWKNTSRLRSLDSDSNSDAGVADVATVYSVS